MRGAVTAALGAVARISGWLVLAIGITILLGSLMPHTGAQQGATALQSSVTAVAALLAGAIMMRAVEHRSPAALGIALSAETPRHVALGVLIGAAGLVVAALLMLATGALRYAAQPGGSASAWFVTVAAQAGLFTLAALAEEAIFRGYGFQVMLRTAGAPAAVAVSSVLFALAHGANPSVGVFALVNIFLAGILLAIAYMRTLSLWFATALHMAWNWTMATLFDLPVSGLLFDTPLYQPAVGGAAWWSGGSFGPEGGLVGTIGFAVALALVIRWRAVRPDPAIQRAGPLMQDTEMQDMQRSSDDG